MTQWPSVEVLIPTHNRPEMLAEAIAGARAQQYPGALSITVIFDRQDIDPGVASDGEVPVRTIANVRKPGLCGARNSGILSTSADFVAFCDDDDIWLPNKLQRQIERVLAQPDTRFVSTSIRVDFADHRSARTAGLSVVPHSRLLESRMTMMHSSTFLIRRDYLVDDIGLVAEDAPGGQNEDWELLLRASDDRPIAHVDEPLVAVRWGSTSMFSRSWETKVSSSVWILGKYPAIRNSKVGYARLAGQIAFAHAALKHRKEALRWALRSIRSRPSEMRGYLAAVVAIGLVSPRLVLEVLHRRGRGV